VYGLQAQALRQTVNLYALQRFNTAVECLFSFVQPWIRKFRGLSKQSLEQAAHTFGLIRSLNITGASVDIITDYLVMGTLRSCI